MNVTLRIPDELVDRLASGGDVERQALEALAVEAYRAGRLTKPELRRLLGFATRVALDAFLKQRGIFEEYTLTDFEQDRDTARRLGL